MANEWGPHTVESWGFVQRTLQDLNTTLRNGAIDESEQLEAARFLARVMTLSTEMTLDADPDNPWFLDMCTAGRMVGGPNPDGNYYLAMVGGGRTYRLTGHRGTSVYLGIQILAGIGMEPRRMAAFVSDTDLVLDKAGAFDLVLSSVRPADDVLAGAQWVQTPPDVSSFVVREYIADATEEVPATLEIEVLDPRPPTRITDEELAERFTSMAWAMIKLSTLHLTIKPELLEQPNVFVTASAQVVGVADANPDNLYMIGTFVLAPDETLTLEFAPPAVRYWNVTLENIFHELLEPWRRHSSVSNKGVRPDADGLVRIAIGASDQGLGHWLDTGGRRRGFVIVRWLDNPEAPAVKVAVRSEGDR